MNASQQLNNWIADEAGLMAASQDEILKMVFEFPSVAAFKLLLAKWQFLKYGEVEEGLWQQLLLQWPDSTQLFIWRSHAFDFSAADRKKNVQSAEQIEQIYNTAEIDIADEPPVWSWKQFLDDMSVPQTFVWTIAMLEDDELHSNAESTDQMKTGEAVSNPTLPIDWKLICNTYLDHIGSVEIVAFGNDVEKIEEGILPETLHTELEDKSEIAETVTPLTGKNDIFSAQSNDMDATETYHPSTFVQWLKSRKKLPDAPVQYEDLGASKRGLVSPESSDTPKQTEVKHKKKKKEKKKNKHKKKDKLEQEIFSSLEFSDEAASETYAALLAKQGHYELSERIYERLRLIYPEKSSYFAGLIKKIKS